MSPQPKLVLLETNHVVEQFQDYVGDWFDSDGESLVQIVVKELCNLLEEWELAEVFIMEVAKDIVHSLGIERDQIKSAAVTKGVYEIAKDLVARIERAGLVKGGLLYYNFHAMQGYNVILKATI